MSIPRVFLLRSTDKGVAVGRAVHAHTRRPLSLPSRLFSIAFLTSLQLLVSALFEFFPFFFFLSDDGVAADTSRRVRESTLTRRGGGNNVTTTHDIASIGASLAVEQLGAFVFALGLVPREKREGHSTARGHRSVAQQQQQQQQLLTRHPFSATRGS